MKVWLLILGFAGAALAAIFALRRSPGRPSPIGTWQPAADAADKH